MSEPLLSPEQLEQVMAGVPPLSREQAAKVAALLQGSHGHRPVLRHVQGRNRVDCSCGAQGLAVPVTAITANLDRLAEDMAAVAAAADE